VSAEEADPQEEEFASLLAAYDEALAGGKTARELTAGAGTANVQPRLQRDLACAELVREVFRRSSGSACWRPESTLVFPAPPVADAPLPWTSLGRFQLQRELGRGSFGIVFLAYDPVLKRRIALKVPRPEAALSPALRERFQREARAAGVLDHPNLVPVYEAGESGPVCYIASAYCPGPTLAAWLRRRASPVPYHQAATLTAILAEAVHHAHGKGIVHRDLKPSNILLQTEECRLQTEPPPTGLADPAAGCDLQSAIPRITDFGLARQLARQDSLTRSGTIVGTAGYMAPEQAGGKASEAGPAADIYALGAILYELLTGRPPFVGETELETLLQVQTLDPVPPSRLRPGMPRNLDTICLHCLDKLPSGRYASAQALADDLQHYLHGEPIEARPAGHAELLWRWCRRKPALAAALGSAVLTLVALIGVGLSSLLAMQQAQAADRLSREVEEKEQALNEAHRQRSLAQELSSRLAMERGLSFCEQGDAASGMLWLAHALQTAPEHAVELGREIRMNLAGWLHQLHRLRGILTHAQPIQCVAFSADGKLVATASDDETARLWDARTAAFHGPPLAQGGKVFCLAFSPDAKLLATGCADGQARLWDTGTGQCGFLLHHGAPIWALAFNADGRLLATMGADTAIRIWDVHSGKQQGAALPAGNLAATRRVVFHPDGRALLIGDHNGMARLWDVWKAEPRGRPFPIAPTQRNAAAFSPNGRILATCGAGLAPYLWDTATGAPISKPNSDQGDCRRLAFSPDGKVVATDNGAGTARLWDAATGRQRGAPLVHASLITDMAFSSDGSRLVIGTEDGTARVWDPERCQPIGMVLRLDDRVESVAFSPDGQTLVIGGYGGSARLLELGTGRRPSLLLPHRGRVQAITLGDNGKLALTGSTDRKARLWNTATGATMVEPLQHQGAVMAVAISPDGKLLLTGGRDRTARIWQARTGKLLAELRGFSAAVSQVRFSPGGELAMAASYDGSIRFWDAGTGQPRGQPLQHQHEIVVAVFSPDGQMLLAGDDGKTARLWHVANRRQMGADLEHRSGINSGAFSPDGRVAATASDDKTARLWDTATGRPLGDPLVHRGGVLDVAFSPDGKLLLTASADWKARLWDVATQQLLLTLSHQGPVDVVAFSPDGKAMVTASKDWTARLWDATSGKALGPAMQHQGPVAAARFSPDGQTILTASGDGTARLWPRPAALAGTVEQIVLWSQMETGMELDEAGDVHLLEPNDWQRRRLRLERLGSPVVMAGRAD
jgi:eukaryotic-like serine/threonine-protein kinase